MRTNWLYIATQTEQTLKLTKQRINYNGVYFVKLPVCLPVLFIRILINGTLATPNNTFLPKLVVLLNPGGHVVTASCLERIGSTNNQ